MGKTTTELDIGNLHLSGWKLWAVAWLNIFVIVGLSAASGAALVAFLAHTSCGP